MMMVRAVKKKQRTKSTKNKLKENWRSRGREEGEKRDASLWYYQFLCESNGYFVLTVSDFRII